MSLWWITRLKQVSSICRLICIAHWNECFLFLVTGTTSERITPTRGLNAARDVYHMRFCLCFSTTEHSACYFALISNIGARTRWHCCHILLYTQKNTHRHTRTNRQRLANIMQPKAQEKERRFLLLSLSLSVWHTYIHFLFPLAVFSLLLSHTHYLCLFIQRNVPLLQKQIPHKT